jgi:Ca2+-binding RTX toxin-like protein
VARVADDPLATNAWRRPAWSADGAGIAFVANRAAIAVADPRTHALHWATKHCERVVNGGAPVYGTPLPESIVATEPVPAVYGGAGDDRIRARFGGTFISGRNGNDVIDARNSARDIVDCGPGNDTAYLSHSDIARHCEHTHRS